MSNFFTVVGYTITPDMYKEIERFDRMIVLLKQYFPVGSLVRKNGPLFGQVYFENINGGIFTEEHTLAVQSLRKEEIDMYDMVTPGVFK